MKLLRYCGGLYRLALTATLAFGPAFPARAGVWSIYWQSDVTPCTAPGPMVNSTYPFTVGGSVVSIMPRPTAYPYYPYDQGQPITVVGYQLIQQLTDPTASGWMAIGSGNAQVNGPDIFAMTAGVGTNAHSDMLPDGGFPVAPSPTYPGG
jgi:hypothetical protein